MDRDDLARKSVKAPSLLNPGMRRASAPPFYTHLQLWSCSVALRPPPTWPSLMRVRAAVLRRGALCGKIGNNATLAHHGCVQGVGIVFPHLPNPSVMLRSPQNPRSPFSPPPPQS